MKWHPAPALLLLLLIAAPPAPNQERTATEEREVQRQELVNLERENAQAIRLNSSTFFNATYADDFYGVTWYGEVVNKAGQIRLIQTSTIQYAQVTASDVRVKMYLDVASVSSLRSERGALDGRQFARQFRILRVYYYSTRGWRVVMQQETPLPTQISR